MKTTAALNLKEHIDAHVSRCVFDGNEIAIRARGPGGRGNAFVTIEDCAIYRTQTGVRAEDKIELLKISGVAWGEGVRSHVEFHGGKETPGYENTGGHEAPPINKLVAKPSP
ncbi:MAG TPA: hypothetical protein PLB55_00825 [Prosthecobacter sp.]|jgi:hypothetical protein|nr:hypothetical protein [Prosthecobacter sp.]